MTPCFTFNRPLPPVGVKAWRSNNIPPKNIDVIVYPYLNLSWQLSMKGVYDVKQTLLVATTEISQEVQLELGRDSGFCDPQLSLSGISFLRVKKLWILIP